MKWILCDERLPEEWQMVLTTIRGHDVIIPQEGETLEEAMERIWNDVCYVSIGFIGSDGWYGADGFPEVVHPIAWMPLPKPYTADRKTKPSNSEIPNDSTISKMEQVEDKPHIVGKHADVIIIDELFDKDINVRSKDEPRIDCRDCKQWEYSGWLGYGCKRQRYDNKGCKFEPKDEPTTQTETQNSNLTFEKDECAKEYEVLGLKELKELIEADRKTEPQTKLCRECDDYAGDGMYCASNHIVYDFSTSKGNCEPQKDCP